MLKNICEEYLEQKLKKMISELLGDRYKGIVEENNMLFEDYERRCFNEATKVILERKEDDKKDNNNNTK